MGIRTSSPIWWQNFTPSTPAPTSSQHSCLQLHRHPFGDCPQRHARQKPRGVRLVAGAGRFDLSVDRLFKTAFRRRCDRRCGARVFALSGRLQHQTHQKSFARTDSSESITLFGNPPESGGFFCDWLSAGSPCGFLLEQQPDTAGSCAKKKSGGLFMEEVYQFLKACGTYYLATMDGEQPRVRPFGTIDCYKRPADDSDRPEKGGGAANAQASAD